MEKENDSRVTEFVLLGLSSSLELQLFLFLIFLLFYMAIVLGNLLIVVTVRADTHLLQSPMYYFLGHLSFIDLCLSCVTVPKMLGDFLREGKIISFSGCLAQIYFLHFLGASEMFLLTAMAYDRYVAICNPLHYLTVMSRQLCFRMVFACWCGGFVHSVTQVTLVIQLPFCGPNRLDNFYCDVPQVVKLACTDTYVVELLMVSNSGLLTLLCFLGLLASYAVILCRVHGSSSEGKSKAVSTCTTHIIVIFLMFGPGIFIYTRPFRAFPADKVISLFHTVIFPLLNPVIYTLRNQEVKASVKRLFSQHLA
ncbi:unnamed protein product [Rangifer tarandus platyrhynchus]|uniref:Olfactory receptor n=1 Tax=Rangifer tarandus platyrhynchus TaxID=3082113 RepID=A0ABN8ZRS3_RANTA|nr:unnamed protein product [Rangifer tarandus platyrhynchus]